MVYSSNLKAVFLLGKKGNGKKFCRQEKNWFPKEIARFVCKTRMYISIEDASSWNPAKTGGRKSRKIKSGDIVYVILWLLEKVSFFTLFTIIPNSLNLNKKFIVGFLKNLDWTSLHPCKYHLKCVFLKEVGIEIGRRRKAEFKKEQSLKKKT